MLSARARYLFDLNGYIVVRAVLTPAEVASANAAIDQRQASLCERGEGTLRNTKAGSALAGSGSNGRLDLGGLLEWRDTAVFRDLLAHPRLLPYLHDFLGPGFRLDHRPLLIAQNAGSEGFALHGGPLTASGEFNQHLQYTVRGERIFTTLLAASVALVDTVPGDGGFCVLPGSHKSNFATPTDLAQGESADFAELVRVPATKAGDVVLFSEATVHGALPWRAEHQRRLAIYRFAPSNTAYGRSYSPAWPSAVTEGLSAEQQAVLEPPYHPRLDRPTLTLVGSSDEAGSDEAGGGAAASAVELGTPQTRSATKKAFDARVFGTPYF